MNKSAKRNTQFQENAAEVMQILKEQKKLLDEKKIKEQDPKKKSKEKVGVSSRSKKAGLMFPVGTIDRKLKDMGVAKRIGARAPVFLAAVLEYLTAEVLELAGNHAADDKKTRILPRHIQTAIYKDEELAKYMGKTTITHGGCGPHLTEMTIQKKGDADL